MPLSFQKTVSTRSEWPKGKAKKEVRGGGRFDSPKSEERSQGLKGREVERIPSLGKRGWKKGEKALSISASFTAREHGTIVQAWLSTVMSEEIAVKLLWLVNKFVPFIKEAFKIWWFSNTKEWVSEGLRCYQSFIVLQKHPSKVIFEGKQSHVTNIEPVTSIEETKKLENSFECNVFWFVSPLRFSLG